MTSTALTRTASCPDWCSEHSETEGLVFHKSETVLIREDYGVTVERTDSTRGADDGSTGTRVMFLRDPKTGIEPDEVPADMVPLLIPALETLQALLGADALTAGAR